MVEYSIEDEFEPTTAIHGNIEISFNSKIQEFDSYDPVEEQLEEFILAIGKTGRANRLTLKASEVSSEELKELAETVEEISKKVYELEQLKPENIEEEEIDIEFDRSDRNLLQKVKKHITDEAVETDKVIEKSDLERKKAEQIIYKLKKEGEIFVPEDGKVQRI